MHPVSGNKLIVWIGFIDWLVYPLLSFGLSLLAEI